MEMSYWGAALVLLIAMSRRGDGRREERMSSPCKVFEGMVLSPVLLSATAEQGCPVILHLGCNCCVFETMMKLNVFFPVLQGDGGDTRLLSTPPLFPPLPSPPRPLELPFRFGKPLPMQAGKNAPPSAPSNLLLIVCILTFISNSFH